jgi:DNA-binding IclR family transcriptional regulator
MLAFSDNPSEQETWPEIRADHYIINIGDRHPEFSSLAAPIFERGQTLAAVLSLSGPTSRFTEVRIEENLPRLLNAAAALTKRVGGDPKPIENQIDIMANL